MGAVTQHSTDSKLPLTLTTAAKQHVITYLTKSQHKGLRLSVKKTGCSGLSYVLTDVNEPLSDDVVVSVDATFFVCIEKASYPYLKGIELDYVKQGLNQKFVFKNPNQTGQCGCGESFTIEEA